MDALAGYGSDSDSDEDNKPSGGGGGGGALSGLLTHYSDDSDNDEADNNGANGTKPEEGDGNVAEEKKVDGGDGVVKQAESSDAHAKKKRRRWDNPDTSTNNATNIDNLLPPPSLSKPTLDDDTDNATNRFQSTLLFEKDYTAELRQKLSRQLQNQSQSSDKDNETSKETQRLSKKLQQLHDTFHPKNATATATNGDSSSSSSSSSSSFATHLKSQKEFGNPHLLKSIIEHYSLNPLGSHVGTDNFMGFEYIDRLMPAEERARIAATSYAAGM
mmetsp:Transcript_16982/g.29232  ORF Transcript_16982/g.29232 Transcript_16982/m.29232 type:complete len:273 (+) Transcript_16982:88-906(+)|eukprot:CAMPEP_0183726304 /NCGR_PEP_ID=MMETSP0737-20130205/23044_1 /TAXON_ID=385413 /ORGANISM="Thalassiosira miniscula, Strain CCMP1093" /LENGTH=272 /DNA_ID=CAMNT_0025957619 /DNA_START=72 /DNA_END=890 /DNA_ORIENTATION=-